MVISGGGLFRHRPNPSAPICISFVAHNYHSISVVKSAEMRVSVALLLLAFLVGASVAELLRGASPECTLN
jgi:hypothetical protein